MIAVTAALMLASAVSDQITTARPCVEFRAACLIEPDNVVGLRRHAFHLHPGRADWHARDCQSAPTSRVRQEAPDRRGRHMTLEGKAVVQPDMATHKARRCP